CALCNVYKFFLHTNLLSFAQDTMKKVNIGNVPKMLVPLFESGTIVFCRDFPEWQRLHQKLGVDVHDSDANGASHTMSSENGVLHVIGVFNGKLSTIAHECAHMAFDICSRVGVDVEPGRANETYCYLMSRLVEFCERHIKKPE
ncbi:hypothetical protein, partial [Escherichia coli]|uniref:hypothetical protein n=1 Tax=Escherichia coli TaxID=562 RepID=UPI0035712FC9